STAAVRMTRRAPHTLARELPETGPADGWRLVPDKYTLLRRNPSRGRGRRSAPARRRRRSARTGPDHWHPDSHAVGLPDNTTSSVPAAKAVAIPGPVLQIPLRRLGPPHSPIRAGWPTVTGLRRRHAHPLTEPQHESPRRCPPILGCPQCA